MNGSGSDASGAPLRRRPPPIGCASRRACWSCSWRSRSGTGHEGVTPSELLSEAIAPSLAGFGAILPGPAPKTKPRRDAWIGPWMRVLADRGTIVRKTIPIPGGQLHVERESTRGESHRNPGKVYLHPGLARG
jgi:hypothetical protein